MRQESTYVAAEIAAADSEMQTDLACKKVLAAKEILARIMQGVVGEYKNYTPDEIAERFIDTVQIQLFSAVSPGMTNRRETVGELTESNLQNEATVYFDVKLTTLLPDEYRTKSQIYLHLDVEAQKEYRPGYPIEKRGIYYISRLISAQLEKITKGTDYAGLQKVYSIWICLGKNIPREDQQTITRFYVEKEELMGNAQAKPEDYNLLEMIIIRLGDKETENYLLGMLTTLFWKNMTVEERMSELENTYKIPMKQKLKEEVGTMCTYSAAIRERAEEEGKEAGMRKGMEEGIRKGMEKGMEKGMDRITNLYQKLKSENRFDDLMRAIDDQEYQDRLLKEFGL